MHARLGSSKSESFARSDSFRKHLAALADGPIQVSPEGLVEGPKCSLPRRWWGATRGRGRALPAREPKNGSPGALVSRGAMVPPTPADAARESGSAQLVGGVAERVRT